MSEWMSECPDAGHTVCTAMSQLSVIDSMLPLWLLLRKNCGSCILLRHICLSVVLANCVRVCTGSQLDDIISGIQPAAAAARSALLAGSKPAGSTAAAAGDGGSSRGLLPPLGGAAGTAGSSSRFNRGGLVNLQYEPDSRPGALGSSAVVSRLAQQQQQAEDVVGPAHLVQQHKLRQQQGQALGQQGKQQLQGKAGSSKQPLRMGQFLRAWNSTQQEEQQQQQQEQEAQQQQQQGSGPSAQQHKQQQRQQDRRKQQQLAPPPLERQQGQQQQQQAVLPTDAKSFFKLLQEQLPADQMAAVKELLTAYRWAGHHNSKHTSASCHVTHTKRPAETPPACHELTPTQTPTLKTQARTVRSLVT